MEGILEQDLQEQKEFLLHKAAGLSRVALKLVDELHTTGRNATEDDKKELLEQIGDLQTVIIELNKNLEL